ncbi:MAG: NifU family protein [Alphaproteobacteria bacterium]|nr:NifU family protein [Alphaproteobacteria bacterium]
MFIQTEETPNPATLKFLPGREVAGEGVHDFGSAEEAVNSPLAQRLFAVEGVRGVLLGKDFIAVTKADDETWPALKPALLTSIMDHFLSGHQAVLSEGAREEAPLADSDVVVQIRDLLDHKIRPALAQDGGDVSFKKFEDGIVYLSLKGACAGCPSATLTLKAGVEALLRHYIPEVLEVRQVP